MPKVLWVFASALLLAATGSGQVADAPGITVNLNGATLLHRSGVRYPQAALQAGIEGLVAVEVSLDAQGNVGDARVVSGPPELRRPVLESVLQWHFWNPGANATRVVTVQFQTPAGENRAAPGGDFRPGVVVAQPGGAVSRRIQSIEVRGLPSEARDELLRRLPVRAGDVLTPELAASAGRAVRDFDEHLTCGFQLTSSGETMVLIAAPGGAETLPLPLPQPGSPSRIRVAPAVQQSKLRSAVPPVYPELAKQARIQGTVKLNALIGKDGRVQNVSVISGHPLLVVAALDAVKQWTYEPTGLNGAPTEVQTEIEVPFTLP